MKIFRWLFPILMVAGLAVSGFVVVAALNAAGAPAPVTDQTVAPSAPGAELAAEGRRLFLAKGCVVCHQHAELDSVRAAMDGFDFAAAPNLSILKIDEAFLNHWLHNPGAVKPGTAMPNLNLSDHEIEALSAFLLKKGTPGH